VVPFTSKYRLTACTCARLAKMLRADRTTGHANRRNIFTADIRNLQSIELQFEQLTAAFGNNNDVRINADTVSADANQMAEPLTTIRIKAFLLNATIIRAVIE